MPVPVRRRWTLREVRALIDESPLVSLRYELVDGELLVTRSPVGPHSCSSCRSCFRSSGVRNP